MTKLYTDGLIEYLHNVHERLLPGTRKIDFNSYIFPEEITAEFIASKFNVSLATVLRKLKQLEKDNFLVSKRGNVVGKPGKRLVYFLKKDVYKKQPENKAAFSGQAGVSFRELLYEHYGRVYELDENGSAMLTMQFHIRNVTNQEIFEIPLPKIRFDTYEAMNLYDRLSLIDVDGRTLPYSSDGLRNYKKTRLGQVDDAVESHISDHHSEVVYVIPLEKSINPGDASAIGLKTQLPGSFTNLYEFEYAGLEIHEMTMSASLKIIAPKKHKIKLLKRYKDSSYNRGLIIKDIWSEMRKTDLERKADIPTVTKRTIKWTVEKPAIGYRYLIPFIVIKN